MPADAYTLPWPPGSHVVADGIDVARDFMPWHRLCTKSLVILLTI